MIRKNFCSDGGPDVVRYQPTPLHRLRLISEVPGGTLFFMILSYLWLYRVYQRVHARLDDLPINYWSMIAFSLILAFLFTRMFTIRLRSCRKSNWYAACFIYSSRRIVKLSPGSGYTSCRWSDLEKVVGGIRVIGKVQSIFRAAAPTTLVFNDGKEIELIPEGSGIFFHFRPLVKSAAKASGHGSPLFEVVQQLEEARHIRNSPVLKMLTSAWRKIGGQSPK